MHALISKHRTGCQWRMPPADFPPISAVRHYFDKWRRDGTFVRINDALRKQARKALGQDEEPSIGVEEAQADRLSFDEIFFSVLNGEIIEDYPTDKPYPGCLIYGDSFAGELILSVWAYNPASQWAVFVTVYRPDPDRWIDWRIRRKK